jgi:hypothetical protein
MVQAIHEHEMAHCRAIQEVSFLSTSRRIPLGDFFYSFNAPVRPAFHISYLALVPDECVGFREHMSFCTVCYAPIHNSNFRTPYLCEVWVTPSLVLAILFSLDGARKSFTKIS